jgi:hypothetical protein
MRVSPRSPNMNREQAARQAAFQAVVMGSTPIRFTTSSMPL